MNPPYNKGNLIARTIFSKEPNSEFSILMPASCYFGDKLFKFIKTFEIAPNLFDAAVQSNNSICTLSKIPNSWTETEFFLQYCDQSLKDIYNWNILHDRGIKFIRDDKIPLELLDIDKDFVEHGRAVAINAGNGFGKGGAGYFYNVKKDLVGAQSRNLTMKFFIRFKTKREKDNFSTWWYSAPKGKGLASKLATGTGMLSISNVTQYAIPQIDWDLIDKSELWKKEEYDKAVLNFMGLC